MKKIRIMFLFLLWTSYLISQDYVPYKKESKENTQEYNSYESVQEKNIDGFFDNYIRSYNGDPNVEVMKKNEQIKQEQLKLMKQKEAILLSLDSLENENQKSQQKIFEIKSQVETEKIKKSRNSNLTNRFSTQSNPRNNSNVIYEYERKVIRMAD